MSQSLQPESPSTISEELLLSPTDSKKDIDTAIQDLQPYLLHLQTTQTLDIPVQAVVRLGKVNDRRPPDIDLTHVPDADIISRVHAEIHQEGKAFYIEDLGSSNGTFVNHAPLVAGQRHRLVPGDLISLGKEDKVTFVFKL